MTKYQKSLLFLLFFIVVAPLCAQDLMRGKVLNDRLLDKFIGDWNVKRKFGNGRTAKNIVHGEWVLMHQFVELHYRNAGTPPAYEAIVLIGYDDTAKRYICHWADNFGGAFSGDGFAPAAEGSNAMEFNFDSGQLKNRFAFDPKSGTWTSTIQQMEKEGWKRFCQDHFTRVASGVNSSTDR